MHIYGIDREQSCCQVIKGIKRKKCPMKMVDGRTCFCLDGEWYGVAEYLFGYEKKKTRMRRNRIDYGR